MRLCHGLLCDNAATVWMRGKAWCVPCSIKRFGIVAPVREAGSAAASVTRPLGESDALGSYPSSGVASPLFSDDLVALLERKGWDELDLEWELISRLETL